MLSRESKKMFAAGLGLLVLPVMAGLASCKARRGTPMDASSQLEDVNPGRALSDASKSLMDSPDIKKRKVVLIYYANDTYAPTDEEFAHVNKESLLTKLRAGAKPDSGLEQAQKDKLAKLANRIGEDWSGFRNVVINDTRYLTQSICKSNGRFDMGLVVLRNFGNDASAMPGDQQYRYERPFNYGYCKPQMGLQTGSFTIPQFFDDFRLQSQPLASPIVFRKAIDDVLTHFPMGEFRYVLVTKSHGSKDFAVTPHLSVDVRDIAAEDVWASVLGASGPKGGTNAAGVDPNAPKGAVLDSDKMSTPILDADKMSTPILDVDKMSTPILGDVDNVLQHDMTIQSRTKTFQAVGISKQDYLYTIRRTGGANPLLGMFYPMIFMEACKSGLEYSSNSDIVDTLETYGSDCPNGPNSCQMSYSGFNLQNVGLLYTSDLKGLGYQTIAWNDIFESFKLNKLRDFQDALRAYLDARSVKK